MRPSLTLSRLPLLRLLVALLLSVLSCTVVLAQAGTANGSDAEAHQRWLTTAERAEQMIDSEDVSNASLETMRSNLVRYRETFVSTRDRNSSRIKTLQSQLEALGPEPEEGSEEPQDIAEMRAQLNTQLDRLRVPRVVAEEAYTRADGLIAEIDRILRDRQTARLLTRGPSPLLPEHWAAAFSDLRRYVTAISNELHGSWHSSMVRQEFQNRLPFIVFLVLVGAVLLARGRVWAKRFGNYMRSYGGRNTGVWSFVVSVARILLPLLGVIIIVRALLYGGLFGFRGEMLLEQIPIWGGIFLLFRWLSDKIFTQHNDNMLLPVNPEQYTQTRFLVDLLAGTLILAGMVQLLSRAENISAASFAVLIFPVVVLASLILLRLHRLSAYVPSARDESDDGDRELGKLSRLMRRTVFVLALVAPVLAMAGYVQAAIALIFPVMLTLTLIGTMVVVHGFLVDVYAWLSRRGEAVRDGLASILFAIALILASLPILALIWGARLSDLTELWTKFITGFQVGDIHISPTSFLVFVLIFVVGYVLTQLTKSGLRSALLPRTRLDSGAQNAVVAGTGYIGVFLAALAAITMAGLDLSSLAIVAGALSVGVGFGLQTIVSNFVSGIILLVERPISKGDWIEVGGLMGYVRDISVRSTRIESFDRFDVIVPNSDLISGTVTNYTRGNTIGRAIVTVEVAYGSDTRKVEAILNDIANNHPMVLANPAPYALFKGIGSNAYEFEIRAILRDVNWILNVKSDMYHEIVERFAEAGIETPRPQRDLWLRNAGEFDMARAGPPQVQAEGPRTAADVPEQGGDRP